MIHGYAASPIQQFRFIHHHTHVHISLSLSHPSRSLNIKNNMNMFENSKEEIIFPQKKDIAAYTWVKSVEHVLWYHTGNVKIHKGAIYAHVDHGGEKEKLLRKVQSVMKNLLPYRYKERKSTNWLRFFPYLSPWNSFSIIPQNSTNIIVMEGVKIPWIAVDFSILYLSCMPCIYSL